MHRRTLARIAMNGSVSSILFGSSLLGKSKGSGMYSKKPARPTAILSTVAKVLRGISEIQRGGELKIEVQHVAGDADIAAGVR
jgi:hypothetical protein